MHTHHFENEDAAQTTTRPNASFEIRTSASMLPAELADFYASVMPSAVQSLDDVVSDENEPPLHPFKEYAEESTVFGVTMVIPKPKLRVKREPFAVLHLAEHSSDAKPKPIIVNLEEDGGSEKSAYSETGSPCPSDGEGGRPKGLIRLRAKAPPPIDMSLVNKALQLEREVSIANRIYDGVISLDSAADSKVDWVRMGDGSADERDIPNAPMMSNVPLPPVTPTVLRSRVTTTPVELALVIPTIRRPKMPMTPKRQALLDILNGVSSVDKTVGKGEEI
jgi:hypothetical protein